MFGVFSCQQETAKIRSLSRFSHPLGLNQWTFAGFIAIRQLISLNSDDSSPTLLSKAVLCKNWIKIANRAWLKNLRRETIGDVSEADRNLACRFAWKSQQFTKQQQQQQSCLEFPRIRKLKFKSSLKLYRLLHRNQLQPHQQRFQQSRNASYATRCRRLSRKC